MHLVQLLLPVRDVRHVPIEEGRFAAVRRELTEHFGGVTAYMRTPATGLWIDESGQLERDEVIMVEVVTEVLDRGWWRAYCHDLERRFEQDTIHARALAIESL